MENRRALLWVIIGDVAAVLLISIVGFLTHYGEITGWRWLTTFFPVLAAWIVFAPWVGVYRADGIEDPRQAWRAGLAAFLSAPFAAWLRGALLNSPILPVFVLVLGLTNALGFLLWRLLVSLFLKNRSAMRQPEASNG